MTPKAPDYGHREADKKLIALARRLHLSYRQARISLSEKIENYLEEFEKQDAEKRALYDSGELSHEDFIKWREQMITDTRAWRDMSAQLANDMTKQNEIAASMINDTLPDVYAINHNYGTYEAEVGSGIDTTYTMYDKFTVKRLLTEDEDLLPHPSVPVKKDKLWNRQRINSAVLQGILTGEPMKDIAKRLESVSDMTERSAMRNARTAVTGAENAGRIDSYKRAVSMGIKMKQVWLATLDGRTRDSHAMMDGEKVEVGKKFSNGCRYPGDPQGAPAEIYNCRCTLVAEVEGSDAYDASTRTSAYLQEKGLTYEQWQEMHGERYYNQLFKQKVVQGKNITETWQRRPEKFSFAIEDVINAQKFDGLPQVVSGTDFQKAVEASKIVMQRAYCAETEEILEQYRRELYYGKWYVDCSVGGDAYGKGMYTAYNTGTELQPWTTRKVNIYTSGYKRPYGYTETMTLSPDAKIISHADAVELKYKIKDEWEENQEKYINSFVLNRLNSSNYTEFEKIYIADRYFDIESEDSDRAVKWYKNLTEDEKSQLNEKIKSDVKQMKKKLDEIDDFYSSVDEGTASALFGYDAVMVGDDWGELVVLNRTKVIIKEDAS